MLKQRKALDGGERCKRHAQESGSLVERRRLHELGGNLRPDRRVQPGTGALSEVLQARPDGAGLAGKKRRLGGRLKYQLGDMVHTESQYDSGSSMEMKKLVGLSPPGGASTLPTPVCKVISSPADPSDISKEINTCPLAITASSGC